MNPKAPKLKRKCKKCLAVVGLLAYIAQLQAENERLDVALDHYWQRDAAADDLYGDTSGAAYD